MRLAVVLANLGGPDRPEAVRPFLFNLFNDPAIIGARQPLRFVIAQMISRRRAPIAREIYGRIGGRSPILEQTQSQAATLEQVLGTKLDPGTRAKVFVAMRYWHPFLQETAEAVRAWAPDRIVLLPLYPQFSTTTTASFFMGWDKAAGRVGLRVLTARLCCYPGLDGFIAAHRALLQPVIAQAKAKGPFRVLFSAHGLPQRIVKKGDPYPWQVEQTVDTLVRALGEEDLDWKICYQSRVGPLAWTPPFIENEIDRAGRDRKGLIVVPIAFVSEHSETLVELDLDYAKRARTRGVPFYLRVPTLGAHPAFMDALASLTLRLARSDGLSSATGGRICPASSCACPNNARKAEHAA